MSSESELFAYLILYHFDLSELKKTTFIQFYDFYVATATEAADRLDGQPMKVLCSWFASVELWLIITKSLCR